MSFPRIPFASLLVFAALAGFAACGGKSSSDDGDDGGKSGSAGAGGSATGGSSGGSTTGGAGGSAGSLSGGTSSTGGTTSGGTTSGGTTSGGTTSGGTTSGGGTTPTGGVSGSGAGGTGTGGGGRECETADDCMLFTDCCTCAAVPKGTSVPICQLVCIQNRCAADQIDADEVTCSFGRCVLDRRCDHAQATCNSNPEPCSGGQVRSVNENGCWGPCIPPTECRDVTNCDACGDAVCVIEEPQIRSFGCVVPDASCTKGNYCECLGACPTSGFVCVEESDAVRCPCPVC